MKKISLVKIRILKALSLVDRKAPDAFLLIKPKRE